MAIPDEAAVRETLQPYLRDIAGAVLDGWTDWSGSTEYARSRYPRTRACVVWERIVSHARHRLSRHSRIHAVERNESVAFFFHDQVLVRFKKGDTAGMSRNVATQLALRYHNPQYTLFGEHVRVEVVYTLNVLQTRVIDIQVVARKRTSVAWAFSIMPSAEISCMPIPNTDPDNAVDDLVAVKRLDEPKLSES